MKRFLVIFIFYTTWMQGQSNFVSLGGDIKNSTGSISYTIGPLDYLTTKSNIGLISQGVQQTYQIVSTPYGDGIGEIELRVMPNPTFNVINLIFEKFNALKYQYSLFDLKGVMLQKGKIIDPSTPIHMESFPPSTYLLHIANNQVVIRTFKIIKSN